MSDELKLKMFEYRTEDNFLMKINLNSKSLYPGNKLTGFLELIPKKKKPEIKFSRQTKEISIIFKLTQFEKLEYLDTDEEVSGKSKSNTEIIFTRKMFYFFPCNKNDLNNKKIDFSILLPGAENQNFLPSFEYHQKRFHIFIRHLLTIEIKDLQTKSSTGIIICKPPKYEYILDNKYNNIEKNNIVSILGFVQREKISYWIKTSKNSYRLGEGIPLKIGIDSTQLKNAKIEKIMVNYTKNIEVKKKVPFRLEKEINIELDEKTFEGDDIKQQTKQKFQMTLTMDKCEKNLEINQENEIDKLINFDKSFLESNKNKKIQLTPPVETEFFRCEYVIDVIINFNDLYKVPRFQTKEPLKIDFYTLSQNKDFSNFKYLKDTNNETFGTKFDGSGFSDILEEDFGVSEKDDQEESEEDSKEEENKEEENKKEYLEENIEKNMKKMIFEEKNKSENSDSDEEKIMRLSTAAEK